MVVSTLFQGILGLPSSSPESSPENGPPLTVFRRLNFKRGSHPGIAMWGDLTNHEGCTPPQVKAQSIKAKSHRVRTFTRVHCELTEPANVSEWPQVFVIAGPNGAGKSTLAPVLLRDHFGLLTFVNADVIAAGLSAYAPETAAIQAGRIMLSRLEELRQAGKSFAFETTLATRGYARWLKSCKSVGYRTNLIFMMLPSPEVALDRVAERVRLGGHSVADNVVRRRFDRGLRNFFQLYQPIVDQWVMLDNGASPKLVAHGGVGRNTIFQQEAVYLQMKETHAT